MRLHLPALLCALAAASLTGAQASRAGDLTTFQMPSGNIHCDAYDADDGGGRVVECELIEKSSSRPARPRPQDCDLEWGNRFILNEHGRANLLCFGDTLRDKANPVLDYGETREEGSISCDSSEKGITCTNADGHGFALSRARQQLF